MSRSNQRVESSSFNSNERNRTLGDRLMTGAVAISAVIGALTMTHIFDAVDGVCVDAEKADILPAVNAQICAEIFSVPTNLPFLDGQEITE